MATTPRSIRSIQMEVEGGVVATERPPDDPPEPGDERPGYDHYVLSEVVADLAVYHATD